MVEAPDWMGSLAWMGRGVLLWAAMLSSCCPMVVVVAIFFSKQSLKLFVSLMLGQEAGQGGGFSTSAAPVTESALCFRVCVPSVTLSFIRFYECVGGNW